MADWYTSEDLEKRMAKEMSIEAITKDQESDENEEILHYLIRNQKNFKLPKSRAHQKIYKKDLQHDGFLGDVLRNYNEALKIITNDINNKNDGKRFLRTRLKFQVNQDMIDIKDCMIGTFGYNSRPSESTLNDLDLIDLNNPVHIKALIPLRVSFDPNNDLSFITMELEEIIQIVLNDDEKLIVEMIRDELKVKEIAEEIGITYKSCQYKIKKIIEKIADH